MGHNKHNNGTIKICLPGALRYINILHLKFSFSMVFNSRFFMSLQEQSVLLGIRLTAHNQ